MYTVEKIWICDERLPLSGKALISSNENGSSSLAFHVGGEILVVQITDMQVEKLIKQAKAKKLVTTI